MTESNLISDAISDVFKKTKVFEKIQNFEFYVGSFVFISSIIGISGIAINYYNNQVIDEKLSKLNRLLENNSRETNKTLAKYYDLSDKHHNEILKIAYNNGDKIMEIRNEYIMLFDRQQNIIREILNLPLLNKDCISRELSNLSQLIEDNPEKKSEIIVQETNEISVEEDELVDECYDSIPLSNAKKVTGIKSLIWFNK